jgi:hypothetical protein
MKRTLAAITACLFAMSGAALAEDAHHPNDATKAPATAPANPAAPAMGGMGRMHEHMKRMQEQMSQIRAASDPKEKARLIDEHMKIMEESMSMMKGMMSCGMM